jgi:uncharacterized protein YbjT (DUF2867 family)
LEKLLAFRFVFSYNDSISLQGAPLTLQRDALSEDTQFSHAIIHRNMILVTGGTGFIGKVLVRHLVEHDYPVRMLIRPSRRSPDLPRSTPVEVAVSSILDDRGLRAALVGVDTVYHLAGAERGGARGNLMNVDIQGTQAVARAAVDAGVRRFFYISHLGADRASAFPLLKAKGIAEEFIRRSGLDYTILRSALVYGANDHFTSGLARLLQAQPFFFLVPGDGQTLLQPLWVEDLVTCLVWALDDSQTRGQTYALGGPEFLPFNAILGMVMEATQMQRRLVPMAPPYLRFLTVILEHTLPALPASVYWLDYLAANRTCALDTIPRTFKLLPSRFSHRLDYLKNQNWRISLFRSIFHRPS